jgi:hypothetical protein
MSKEHCCNRDTAVIPLASEHDGDAHLVTVMPRDEAFHWILDHRTPDGGTGWLERAASVFWQFLDHHADPIFIERLRDRLDKEVPRN